MHSRVQFRIGLMPARWAEQRQVHKSMSLIFPAEPGGLHGTLDAADEPWALEIGLPVESRRLHFPGCLKKRRKNQRRRWRRRICGRTATVSLSVPGLRRT